MPANKCDLVDLEPVLASGLRSAMADGEQAVHCVRVQEKGFLRAYLLTDRKVLEARVMGAFGIYTQPTVSSIRLDQVAAVRGQSGVDGLVLTGPANASLDVYLPGARAIADAFRKAVENQIAAEKGTEPGRRGSVEERLRRLKSLCDEGLLTESECTERLKQILAEI